MALRILKQRCSSFNFIKLSKCCGIKKMDFLPKTRFICIGVTKESEMLFEQNQDEQCVSDEVAKWLELSKPTFVNGRYVKAKLSARRLAKIRKQYVSDGYYWPTKPLRDRSLDMVPKYSKKEKAREERRKLIEENMKKMPEMIAEYRAKMKDLRAQKRELKEKQKEKQLEAQRLGYHPKDPRGLQKLMQAEALEAKKNKRMQKRARSSS
ncbi:uncharacterized protein LOC114537485 isoform X2 [Dendronephthya gigantea]|uniref:uncharacterized protein LOC114537485 isoform X2 n=1 Tax=Dendronephthya gigantea TaxID=151771 RepID=UPI00106B24D5|nr:uncharacterized protein LOC114537485 isoform X2 [Dendronephthya gigantea]